MLRPGSLKTRVRTLLAATALFALAGASSVYAQQDFGGHGFGGMHTEQWHRPSIADINAFADARIAALKAGLELNPDQAKNWPPFEQALRDLVQLRVQRLQAQQSEAQQPPASPFDRLARRADAMAKTSAALKKMADAGAPLYASLNDEQKGRFVKLARILRPHPHGFMQHGWHQGFGHQGFGHQGFGPGRFGGDDGDDGGDTGSRL